MAYPPITKEFFPEAVILGDGEFPSSEIPLDILKNAKYLCCCDGAAMHSIERGIMPDAIVGDGDSMSPEFKEKYKDIIHIVSEQEDNDLTKATRHCTAKGLHSIAYVGATGKREDHTLGNISLILKYMDDLNVRPVMFTDYGYFLPANGSCAFATFPRQQISIFNFSCNRIAGQGLKWDTYTYRSWWQGTLNEATGNHVEFDTDGSFIVYLTYKPKN